MHFLICENLYIKSFMLLKNLDEYQHIYSQIGEFQDFLLIIGQLLYFCYDILAALPIIAMLSSYWDHVLSSIMKKFNPFKIMWSLQLNHVAHLLRYALLSSYYAVFF